MSIQGKFKRSVKVAPGGIVKSNVNMKAYLQTQNISYIFGLKRKTKLNWNFCSFSD